MLREFGGAITGDELALILQGRYEQPIATVARWILNRELVSVRLDFVTWIPVFQFRPGTFRPYEVIREIMSEFEGLTGDHELVEWFINKNMWLGHKAPAAVLETSPASALTAARLHALLSR